MMLVILSGGMLTGLTATMIQAAPVYADTDDCKRNDDHNCNTSKRDLKTEQDNNCKAEDGGANANGGDTGDTSGDGGAGGSNDGNDNRFTCTNTADQPNTGDDSFNVPKQNVVVVTTSNDPFALIG